MVATLGISLYSYLYSS